MLEGNNWARLSFSSLKKKKNIDLAGPGLNFSMQNL